MKAMVLTMKLRFKQRFFSWLDSYDIFDEAGQIVYTVKGRLAFGHCLEILSPAGSTVGLLKERIFSFRPQFEIYLGDEQTYLGCIRKEFTFFRPRFHIDVCDWELEGDFFEWDYRVHDRNGRLVATVSKELFNWTDTYVLDVERPEDALSVLLLVLAIDAEKCSRN